MNQAYVGHRRLTCDYGVPREAMSDPEFDLQAWQWRHEEVEHRAGVILGLEQARDVGHLEGSAGRRRGARVPQRPGSRGGILPRYSSHLLGSGHQYAPRVLRVLVTDHAPDRAPELADAADLFADQGMELNLVAALSWRWGWHRAGYEEKQVWCTFMIAPGIGDGCG